MRDAVIESRNLFFIQFAKGLCFPFEKEMPPDLTAMIARHLVERLATRDELVRRAGNYQVGLYIMPIQRFFHRTRIHGFEVIGIDDYLKDFKGESS